MQKGIGFLVAGLVRVFYINEQGEDIMVPPWYFRKIILPYFMKWLKYIIDDKNIMEPDIMNSNYHLASFMVDQLSTPMFIHLAPSISN